VDNNKITNKEAICEIFAEHFVDKVNNLSNSYIPLTWEPNPDVMDDFCNITFEEIKLASKPLKSKLCCGEDGLAMKVIIDLGSCYPHLFQNLFNSVVRMAMPINWNMALVTPIHKKGTKDLVSQYRTISNLTVLASSLKN